jgi:Cu+-exporting ATPase
VSQEHEAHHNVGHEPEAAGSCCHHGDHEPPREPAPAAPPGTIYTCPMHPEIEQVGPGSCPI